MPRATKRVVVTVKNGAVVRKDGRSFHFGQELSCTIAEATSYYLSNAAYLPDDREDASAVLTRARAARADAERRTSERPKPEAVEDPRDFERPPERAPIRAVVAPIAPPPPVVAA